MLPGIGILPLQLMPLKALPRLSLAANVPAGRRESGRGRGVGVPSSHKVGPCGTQTPCHGRGRGVSHVTGPPGAILSGSPAAEPSLFLLLITSLLYTCPWNSPGQNTGMGSLTLFKGIFPTQGSNPGLSYCRWILYQVSRIADGFFTSSATREAQEYWSG